MNSDDFEKWLRWQTTRRIPGEWREEILRDAQASTQGRELKIRNRSWLSDLNCKLSTILWPNPKAWAGLGAAWILILALQFAAHDSAPRTATKSPPPSPELVTNLKDQQRMLAELFGNNGSQPTTKPAQFPAGPRTERIGRESII